MTLSLLTRGDGTCRLIVFILHVVFLHKCDIEGFPITTKISRTVTSTKTNNDINFISSCKQRIPWYFYYYSYNDFHQHFLTPSTIVEDVIDPDGLDFNFKNINDTNDDYDDDDDDNDNDNAASLRAVTFCNMLKDQGMCFYYMSSQFFCSSSQYMKSISHHLLKKHALCCFTIFIKL
jgi:hypothetical protein